MATDYSVHVRTWLLSIADVSSAVATRVYHNYVPEAKLTPYVWLSLASEERDKCIDEAAGSEPISQIFNVEICGQSLSGVIAIANAIKAECPFRGTLGGVTVQMCDVDNHDEEYLPQNEFSDDVRHIQTLILRIFP